MNIVSYFKIPAVFLREVIPGKKSWPTIFGKYCNKAVEYLKDLQWYGACKIDGTNTRLVWDGSRVTVLGHKDKSAIPFGHERFETHEMEEVFEQVFGAKQAVVFGETYGYKIGTMGPTYGSEPMFSVFDVWCEGSYLDNANVEAVASRLGLGMVQDMRHGTLEEIVREVCDIADGKKQVFDPNGSGKCPIEGFVCRPAVPLWNKDGTPLKVKVKVCDMRGRKEEEK